MAEYPDVPGAYPVDTSRAAAEAIAPMANFLRSVVLRVLYRHPGGLTVDELCAKAGYPRYSLQPRFTELKYLRMIRDTGLRRRNVSGRNAIVWRLVAADADADAQEQAA